MSKKCKFNKEQEEIFRLEAVRDDIFALEYIKKPSLLLQVEAVKRSRVAISNIKNPSLLLQLEAVRQNGLALEFIDNPSEQVQLEAVRQDGLALEFINNPSEQVQLEAVRQNGRAIKYIDNPSEQVQLEAVRECGFAILYTKNPTSYIKSIVDVIKTSGRHIYVLHEPNKEPLFSIGCQHNITKEYFMWRIYNLGGGLEENPYRREYLNIINRYINKDKRININEKYQFSKEQEEIFQLKAVRQNGLDIKSIDNPSLPIQLEAVKEDGYAIKYIDNISEEVQLEAIRQDETAIQYIENPSEQLQLEALKENVRAIEYIDNPSDYIKSIVDVIETSHRNVYVLHEPNKEPLFTTGCQCNLSKEYFIWRIYNLDGGLKENPHRQEYLDIIERY